MSPWRPRYHIADKIDVLVKKGLVRHLYDIIFMLSQKYPVNEQTMKKFGYKKDPLEIILERVNGFTAADLKNRRKICGHSCSTNRMPV